MRKLHFFSTLVALFLATTTLWALPTGVVDGKLPGVFTVACGEQVYFSQGNLQYIGSEGTPYWKFANEQYEYLGDNGQAYSTANINRDLFGWGTGDNPCNKSKNTADYSTWHEWGENVISNGGNSGKPDMWRTLTHAEWNYLLHIRRTGNNVGGTPDARFTKATINTDGTSRNGIILFPDNYSGGTPQGVTWVNINGNAYNWGTTCTTAGWTALENAGCVFLPCSGCEWITFNLYSIVNLNYVGYFWSSSNDGDEDAFALSFAESGTVSLNGMDKPSAFAVRLVQDVPEALEPVVPVASVSSDPAARTPLKYNGSYHSLITPAGTATGGTTKYRYKKMPDGDYSDWGSTYTSYHAVEVGEYNVQWFVDPSDNDPGICYLPSTIQDISVTIARGTASIPYPRPTISAATSLTYNGSAQNLVTTTGDDLQEGYTLVYSTDGITWSPDIPQGTSADDYTVYYKFYQGDNYEYIPSSNTFNVTIAKADLPVGPLPASTSTIDYDETEKILLEIDPVAGATIWYKLGDDEWTTELPKATDAADYSVQYKIVPDDTDNYNTIGPNTVTVTIKDYPTVADNADPTSVLAELNNSGSPAPTNLKVKRTIYADGEYNTICLPFAVSASELTTSTHPLYGYERLKAFKGASVSGSGQDLSIDIFVEDVDHMDAGVPYLITYPAGNADIVNPVFQDITVTTTTPDAVSADGVTFQGMFAQVHIDPYTEETRAYDYLFLGANSQLMWPNNDGSSMRGFRAYFIIDRTVITPAAAPSGTRARFVNAPKQPTAIEEINTTNCTKFIENGQLIILKNGIKYNAQGQVLK